MENSIEKEVSGNKGSGDRVLQALPNFKDMKKETIGQTYYYLNQLLKNKSCEDFENLSELLDLKKQLPFFEESLRLIIIDSLHLENEVLQIFLNQNNYQIKRILRCQWFFRTFLDSAHLKNQIFPHVSVSLRGKIINKLSRQLKKENNADELFDYILKSYGRAQAEILLPKCSDKFILNYFSTQNILLKYNNKSIILLRISKRNPKLGIMIFSILCDKPVEEGSSLVYYNKPLLYLAKMHSEIFIPLFKKFYLKLLFLKFGHKLSKKMGPQMKEILFESKELLNSLVFKKSAFFKKLCFEDQVKFLTAIVLFKKNILTFESWKESLHIIISFVKLITPNQRIILIETVFQKVFNRRMSDYPHLLSIQLLELLPLQIRYPYLEAYAKSLAKDLHGNEDVNSTSDDNGGLSILNFENLTHLLDSATAFKNLKQRIAKTPLVNKRQEILELMIQNCAVNKDINQLQEVVDFIGNRMRNDDPKVLMLILQRIFELFTMKAIKIEVINKIQEITHICFLKNEGQTRGYESVMEKCILFKMNENLDVTRSIKDLVDYKFSTNSLWMEFIDNVESEHSRKFILAFYEEVQQKLRSNTGNITARTLLEVPPWILMTLLKFNNFHKKNPILLDDCPGLQSKLQASFTRKIGEIMTVDFDVTHFVKERPDLILKSHYNYELLVFMLKKNPEIFARKIESLLKHFTNFFGKEYKEFFIFSLKIFSFMNLTEDLKRILVALFKNEMAPHKKKNALKMFSYICSKEEFEELTKEYIPNSDRMDVENNKDFTQVQLAVPQYIKNIIPSYKNLDFILKFFVGDFLKNATTSFSKYCYNTRVDQLIPNLFAYLIKISCDKRISPKKEAIKALVRFSPRQNVISVCLDLWKKIDHYSIRTIILKQISHIFIEEPTTELFNLLDKMIKESDEEIIEASPGLHEIPQCFLQPYVSSLWTFAENKKLEFRNNFRNSILAFFTVPTISLLSPDFCNEVIKNNLFKAKGLNVVKFAVNYLLCQRESITKKLGMLVELMKNSASDLDKISNFFKTLRIKSLDHSEVCEELFDSLCNHPMISKSNFLFDEYLMLSYYRMHHDSSKTSSNERPLKFAQNLIKFYGSFEDFNSLLMIFLDSLNLFFEEVKDSQNFNKIAFLKEFLNLSPNRGFVILVILALPVTVFRLFKCDDEIFDSSGDNFKNDLKYIFETLRTNSDSTVQIYFRRKFGFRNDENRVIL